MADDIPGIIVIGASAGGLKAISRIVGALPADFPVPILYVSHIMEGRRSELPGILSRRTALGVREVADGDRLEAGRLHVVAAAQDVVVGRGALGIGGEAGRGRLSPSIDRAMISAARSYGARTLAVILTGMLDDGVEGLKAVHRAGGTALVQDPEEADFPSMPREAIARDHPDRVLTLAGVTDHLLDLAQRAREPQGAA